MNERVDVGDGAEGTSMAEESFAMPAMEENVNGDRTISNAASVLVSDFPNTKYFIQVDRFSSAELHILCTRTEGTTSPDDRENQRVTPSPPHVLTTPRHSVARRNSSQRHTKYDASFTPFLMMMISQGQQRREDDLWRREEEGKEESERRREETRRHQQFLEMMAMVLSNIKPNTATNYSDNANA